MKNKFILSFCAALGISLPFMFTNSDVQAFTIKENDGNYALVMNIKSSDKDAHIDYLKSKIVTFDFDEGETGVKLSDLTQGIVPFNGENEFSGWALSSDSTEAASEDTIFTKSDFNVSGRVNGVNFENGKNVYALFNGKSLKDSDNCYLTLDAYGGKMPDGNESLRLVIKRNGFTKVELGQYTPQREECNFFGWGLDGKIVNSIDKNYFNKNDVVKVTALYKSTTFYGVDENGLLNKPGLDNDQKPKGYILTLDANGGIIDDVSSKEYDYLDDGSSGTEMYVFHYIPERKGYKFTGWNSERDGSGKPCASIYCDKWTNGSTEYHKSYPIKGQNRYANLTLYATWEKASEDEDKDGNKEILTRSESELEGSLTFEEYDPDDTYTLDIKKLEIPENFANTDIKLIVDINMINKNSEIVEVNGIKMKIKIKLPEELKGYDNYEVVYINSRTGNIKETLPATIEDGYIVFETTHLSQYGIIAKKIEKNDPEKDDDKSSEEIEDKDKNQDENIDLDKDDETDLNDGENIDSNKGNEDENNTEPENEESFENFITGDATTPLLIIFSAISVGMMAFPILNKRK